MTSPSLSCLLHISFLSPLVCLHHRLAPPLTAGLISFSLHRGIIGALGCGYLADWLSRRAVIAISLVISYAAITLEFVALTNSVFFGGKFLNGFAVGALASVTVTYIGEVRSESPLLDSSFLYFLARGRVRGKRNPRAKRGIALSS